MPVDTMNTIRIRQQKPTKFKDFRTKDLITGVKAIIGIKENGGSAIQSFMFDKTLFDLKKAKEWVREHNEKLKEELSVPYVNMVSILKEDTALTPNEDTKLTSDGTIDIPKEDFETIFDIKHPSNGKIDKEKVLKELDGLRKFETSIKKDSFDKMTHYLKAKLKESYKDFLQDNGFNLLESETPISADTFDITILQESTRGVAGSSVKRALVRLIKSGESKNGNIYTGSCLREATPLFDGLPIFPDHVEDKRTNDDRSVTEKVGFYSEPKFVGNDENGEIQAIANILESSPKIWDLIKEQFLHPNAKLCGFSINAFGKGKKIPSFDGKSKILIEKIVLADSTDVVSKPSAGGGVIQILESVKKELSSINSTSLGEDKMDLKTLKENHSDIVKQIEDDAKALALKEAEATDSAKSMKCPYCDKSIKMKESVEHCDEHMKEVNTKLTEAESKISNLERVVAINSLTEKVQTKLTENASLPEATKKRLVKELLKLGEEVREGDKPSNWDLVIKEELDYAKQLKGANLELGSDRTETKKVTENGTLKLTEQEQRTIGEKLSKSI